MRYNLEQQERPYWCAPACLQAILEFEGFYWSQERIAEQFEKSKEGLAVSPETLKIFLDRFNLQLEFWNPFREFDITMALEKKIRQAKNNLVGYDYQKLLGKNN